MQPPAKERPKRENAPQGRRFLSPPARAIFGPNPSSAHLRQRECVTPASMSLDLVLNSAAMQLPPSKLIARLGRPPPSPLEVAERIEHKALRSSARVFGMEIGSFLRAAKSIGNEIMV